MYNNDLKKITIAIIGDANCTSHPERYKVAHDIGKALIDNGYRVITGGMGGVMEAGAKGARSSRNYQPGSTIALLPGTDPAQANQYSDIVIPTGLDNVRNMIVAQSEAVIAVGGGAGTLSEIAFAWIYKRLIIGMKCGGWSQKLGGTRIDHRKRYPEIPEDKVFIAETPKDALSLLKTYLPRYTDRYRSIKHSKGSI